MNSLSYHAYCMYEAILNMIMPGYLRELETPGFKASFEISTILHSFAIKEFSSSED